MTPEQLKIHREKAARLAEKSSKKKEVLVLVGVAALIFSVGIACLGTMIYAIKKNNPHHTQEETQKIHDMNYEEAQHMNDANN